MPTLTFDYRPALTNALLLLLVSALFTVGLVWLALGNTSRIDILGFVLSVQASTAFFWFGAAFFGLGIPASLKMAGDSIGKPRQVMLSDTEITAPKGGFFKVTKVIAFRDVTACRVVTVQRNTFLEIKGAQQKLTIPKSYIRPAAQFDALAAAVEKRITAARING
ncbi:hypothetical protein ACJ5NV_03055 [Loktanella agnita]|uniref:hypothetical protein n=1 Tax=Loktanella agnita TaxID=287097 RepID=UPI0039869993